LAIGRFRRATVCLGPLQHSKLEGRIERLTFESVSGIGTDPLSQRIVRGRTCNDRPLEERDRVSGPHPTRGANSTPGGQARGALSAASAGGRRL